MSEEILPLTAFTVEELEELTIKCVDFIEMFCDVRFFPYQRDFSEAIVKDILAGLANTLTGLFSRQSGKSETVANSAAALMILLPKLASLRGENNKRVFPQLKRFEEGLYVGIFAPSNFQSGTTYSRLRVRTTGKNARMFLDTEEFALNGDSAIHVKRDRGDYLELSNGSFVYSMSADKQSKIESKTFHLLLLDESQDLDELVVHKSIMPMGAHTRATSVATGTPGTTKGFFYRMIENNKADQLDRRRQDRYLQPQLHFENGYKTVQKYQEDYKFYIGKEKRRIGEESDEFQMAYNLVWLLERGMAVPQYLFEKLTDKKLDICGHFKEDKLIAGLDWGKGSDSTVLTIGRPRWDLIDERGLAPVEVISWWEKVGDDYESIFAGVKDHLSNYSIHTIACDATGVGEPLVDRLIFELPYVTVVPVKFTPQSKDHLYKFFLLMLGEEKCRWPGNSIVRNRKYFKNFEHQMLNLVKEYKGTYLACHAPVDIRNAHDDYPDSLALMLWCINEEAMPTIEVSSTSFWATGRQKSKDTLRTRFYG